MKSPAGLIGGIIKFSAGMKGCKYKALRTDSLLMHPHRYAPSVILHRGGAIRLQNHGDPITEACQVFIHRIIHNFIYQMIEPPGGDTPDIHTGPFSHRLKALQHGYAGGIINWCICHMLTSFLCLCGTISNLFAAGDCKGARPDMACHAQ